MPATATPTARLSHDASKGPRISGVPAILFPVLTLVLGFMVLAPLGFLVYGALTDVPLGDKANGITLENFRRVLTHARYLQAIWHSIQVATLSTIIACLIGVLMAWLVIRTDVPFPRLLRIGVMVPFFVAPFIGALAWSLLCQKGVGPLNLLMTALGLPEINLYTLGGIVWVMGLFYAPYVFIFTSSALYNMDPMLEESGYMSGLNRRQVMLYITVPLVTPAILSGMLLTFVATAGQFGVPAVLGAPRNFHVMTTYIFDLTQQYPTQFNSAAALSFVLLFITVIGIVLQNRVMKGRSYTTIAGKGFRPRIIELKGLRWVAFAFAFLFVILASVLPLLMIGYVSLVPLYTAKFSFSLMTLANYKNVFFDNPMGAQAISNTLILSIGAATVSMILGVVLNWIIHRSRVSYRGFVDLIVMVPISVPHVVLAIGMLWTYIYLPLPIYGTLWILLIGYVTGFLPYAVRNVGATFVQIDKSLEEAATMVGASWARTVREVTIPLLKPGMVGAWMLLFIIFVRELTTSIFLYSPNSEVLSVLIYNRWAEGDYTALSAMAMIQVLVVGLVIFLAGYLFKVDITRSQS
ncbi:MAG: iron ABC transporter permease [Hyphomicrobiaceae bacterium]|nr:iron ABC transporter permease [Hyphomicrobiaceae bacterium]